MAYLGHKPAVGENNSFRILDDISSFVLTFDGSSASVVGLSDETITITENNHRFITGQRVTYSNGGGGNITGLTNGQAYFVINHSKTQIKLASSASNALAGTAVNLTGLGTGSSHTLTLAFDGVNTKFDPTFGNGMHDTLIKRAAQLVISINGVIQQPHDTATPTTGFGVDSLGHIIFSTAPASTDIFWGHILATNTVTFDSSDNDVDTFTGNGSTTSFTLSKTPPDNRNILVTIDGVVQYPSDAANTRSYNVSENVMTFVAAPGLGTVIQVRHIGYAGIGAGGGGGVTGFYGRTGNVSLQSTDNIVANNATFNGNVSIAQTLTYEDVTDIDAIGLITARSGIKDQTLTAGRVVYVDSDKTLTDSANLTFDGDDVGIARSIFHLGDTNTSIGFPAADTVQFITGGSERLRIKSDGKVGIGTDNPTSKFHIHNPSTSATQILECSNGSVELALKHTNGYGSVNTYYQGTAKWRIGQTGQFDDFSVWQASGVGSGQDPYRLTIKNSGNVGVSTHTPRQIFHVNYGGGTACVLVSSPTAPQIRFNPNATDGTDNDRSILGQATGSNNFISGAAAGDTVLRGTSSGKLLFGLGTSEKLRIDNNGNMGLGTQLASDAGSAGAGLKVEKYVQRNNIYAFPDGHYAASFGRVNNTQTKVWASVDSQYAKTSAVSAGLFLSAFHQDAGGSGCGSAIKNLKTGNALTFSTVTTGASVGTVAVETERVRITASGRVGINTTDPQSMFDTRGNAQVRDVRGNQNFFISDSGFKYNQSVDNWNNMDYASSPVLGWDYKNGPGDLFYIGSGGNTAIASQMAIVVSDHHGFKVGKSGYDGTDYDVSATNEFFRVTTAGKVGINTATPRAVLDIEGNAENATLFLHSNDANANLAFSDNTGGARILNYGGDLAFRTGANADAFGTGDSEKLRIEDNGSVGIGTDDASWALSGNGGLVVGSGAGSQAITIFCAGNADLAFGSAKTGTSRYDGLIRYSHSDDSLQFRTTTDERLRINSSGNVQIGTEVNAGNTLRYLDVANYNTGSSAGSILRLLTTKSDGTSAVGLDIIKYKAGGAYLVNYETVGADTGFIALSTGQSGGSPVVRLRISGAGETILTPTTGGSTYNRTSIHFNNSNHSPFIAFKSNNVTEAAQITAGENNGGCDLTFKTKNQSGTALDRLTVKNNGGLYTHQLAGNEKGFPLVMGTDTVANNTNMSGSLNMHDINGVHTSGGNNYYVGGWVFLGNDQAAAPYPVRRFKIFKPGAFSNGTIVYQVWHDGDSNYYYGGLWEIRLNLWTDGDIEGVSLRCVNGYRDDLRVFAYDDSNGIMVQPSSIWGRMFIRRFGWDDGGRNPNSSYCAVANNGALAIYNSQGTDDGTMPTGGNPVELYPFDGTSGSASATHTGGYNIENAAYFDG